MHRIPIAVACAALCLGAGLARAEDDPDQAAKDRAFERDAAIEAADAKAAGLPLTEATAEGLAAIAERKKDAGPRPWGLLVEGGFPEGVTASVVYRPRSEIRLWAGPAWNYVGWGAQAGVTLVPWQRGVSPLFSIEGGRYFATDARFLAKNASGIPQELKPLLENVSYDYAAAHVGIEIGTRDAFAISIRAGLSYLSLAANGTHTVDTTTTSGGTTSVAHVAFTDPRLRGTIPSVKAGIQLWF
jgi:hypothetical protein